MKGAGPHSQRQDDDDDLQAVARDLGRVAERLNRLISLPSSQHSDGQIGLSQAAMVRDYLRARRLRERLLPKEIFAEPAWDMLLDLFAAEIEGKIVSISSACIASAVPSTTALRWLNKLEECGMIERMDDLADARRANVRLAPCARTAIQQWVAASLQPSMPRLI